MEQLGRIGRDLRSERGAECGGTYAELAISFVAPVANVFACWILARARQSGIRRLYFLSRDGQLILQAARSLAPQFGGIDCRYLQASRQALFLPSSAEISEEGMPWLFENTDHHYLWSLLAKLELEYEQIAPFFASASRDGADFVIRTGEERQEFWAALNQSPLRELLLGRIAVRREASRLYFQEAGLFDPVKRALVDIGWFLRSQRALNDLLRGWGCEEISGFYLGIRAGCESLEKAGPATALFYEPERGSLARKSSPAVFKQVLMIENIFCTADHPTVYRYELCSDGRAVPAYNCTVPPSTLARYRALSAVVSLFAEKSVRFAEEWANPAVAMDLIDGLTTVFMKNPVAEAVRPLTEIKVSFFQNDLLPLPLVRPLTWREAIAPAFPEWPFLRAFWQNPDILWHGGSVAISSRPVRMLYRAAYRMRSIRHKVGLR